MVKLRDLATGLHFLDILLKDICGSCMKGRQRKNINRTERTWATKILAIVD